jgi:hypothetical protein
MTTRTYAVECHADNAARFRDWIANRGGIAVWPSINLSTPGASCSTPALTTTGEPTTRPGWSYASKPSRIVTDPADVGVYTEALFKAIRVSLRKTGLSLKLTDTSQRRVNALMAACEAKHGTASYQRGVIPEAPASIGVFYVTSLTPLSGAMEPLQ